MKQGEGQSHQAPGIYGAKVPYSSLNSPRPRFVGAKFLRGTVFVDDLSLPCQAACECAAPGISAACYTEVSLPPYAKNASDREVLELAA
jgi:hypothetical protein